MLQIGVIGLLEIVLVFLRRLVEEGVDFTLAQQLDQLRQRAVQDAILLFKLFRRLRILTRVLRDFFIGGVVAFGARQLFFRFRQQLVDSRAAADFVGIHHVADPCAVQGVTRLQQIDPTFTQQQLLLTDGLQDGKVLFIAFQRRKKQTA